MTQLDDEKIFRLIEAGDLLSKIEELLGESDVVSDSIELGRDAGSTWMNFGVAQKVTAERTQKTLGALYLAYLQAGHNEHLPAFRELMSDLGFQPSLAPDITGKKSSRTL